MQLRAVSAAATRRARRIGYSLVLVRPKMATTSVSSLVTLSNFHPRFSMSFRQPISFSHSTAVARKTRRSATLSQWGGYGTDLEEPGGFVLTEEEVVRP